MKPQTRDPDLDIDYKRQVSKRVSSPSPFSTLRLAGSAVITFALIYAVFQEQSLDELAQALSATHRLGLTIFVIVSSLGLLLRALRYQVLLKGLLEEETAPTFSALVVVTAVRNALVDLLPARLGELSFLYILQRYGVPLSAGGTTFAVCIVLDIIALLMLFTVFLLGIVCGVPVLSTGSDIGASTAGALLAGVLFLLVFLCFVLNRSDSVLSFFLKQAHRLIPERLRTKTLWRSLDGILEEVRGELVGLRRRRLLGRLLGLTVLLRLAKYGGLYILLVSVVNQWGITFTDINPLVTTTAFITAEASASLPISGLMGFGAYEGAWSLIFSLSGVKIPSVTSAILLTHLITQVVAYIFAFAALAVFLKHELKLRSSASTEK